METKKLYLRFNTIVACVKKIAEQIDSRGFKPDVIVPIVRGGLVPASLLSDLLNVKEIYPIHCSRYNGMKLAKEPRVMPFNYSVAEKNVLLVDDILDTGETFKICQIEIKKKKPTRLMAASLFVRENSERPSFWSNVSKEGEWIVFPWELTEFKGD